jgi:type IX secretion system PorP/SprF family membrane protein
MVIRIVFLLTLLSVSVKNYSQQEAQYTQYMYNTETVNPAYAGSRGVLSIFGLYRTQWVGLDGAPKTATFSINTPIDNSNIGIGVTILDDKIGPTIYNTFSADFSYSIQTSNIYKLSMGIKGTVDLFSFEIDKLNPQTSNDITLQNVHNDFSPNLGAGLYFHSKKNYI